MKKRKRRRASEGEPRDKERIKAGWVVRYCGNGGFHHDM